MAIPTFDIGSLTALWTILVCLHGSEKSGSEKNHFNTKWLLYNVQLCKTISENIHTPLTEGIGISWGMGGSVRTRNLKKCVKLYWNFQRGGRGGLRKTPFRGGGMDIFWSYTSSPRMDH